MKLNTRQDIEAPLDFVLGRLTDFDQFERMAMRRGAEIDRNDKLKTVGPGASWRVRFTARGKPRTLLIRFHEVEPGSHVLYGFDSPSVQGTTRFDLVALSPRRTRMTMTAEVLPKTLAARLVLQSMRLARGRIQKRFDGGAAKLANLVEERFRATARA